MSASILFVGDSITVGAVGYAVGKVTGTAFRGPFLAKNPGIAAVGPFVDPKGLHHGGVGGARTDTFASGKAQWVVADGGAKTWMETYRPDIVHVMLGVNDIIDPSRDFDGHPEYYHAIVDRMALLMNLAAAQWPKAHLLLASITEVGAPWFTLRTHVLNALYKRHAQHAPESKMPGQVQWIDSCAALNAAFYKEGADPFQFTVDGTHFNDRANRLVGDEISAQLNPPVAAPSALATGAKVALAVGAVWGLSRLLGGRAA